VALFFMHLRHSTTLTRIVVAGGLLWLAILITLSMSDFISRGWLDKISVNEREGADHSSNLAARSSATGRTRHRFAPGRFHTISPDARNNVSCKRSSWS
jgi:hypothetical protein